MPLALSTARRQVLHDLYADHHAWLLNWLRKRLQHRESAADLMQDTFLQLIGRPEAPDRLQQPRAWLTIVAKGLMVDRLRRHRLEQAYLQVLACQGEAFEVSPEERLQLLETLMRIDALLDGLPAKVRSAYLLSRLEGLPYRDIARHLGVSLSSVEKYMATAMHHCYRACLS
ncbi:sigma-70 family RNA polymerase sigma factor [Pseudomonas sp. BJa5]|uniref:sigma-70 family RNA polymerase sigma factor n=1 Tax=Pseudomonas sp. BJa5 TaxID=2936270 RepID=UPI0025598593|nr:sigma-70 family RNA polymerase sigma factor [Pseudomonas sp. BGr12]MDL2422995.1 sigma-70 family RNA polymerase sigma factor [Pseudomonas sp. BGr12]